MLLVQISEMLFATEEGFKGRSLTTKVLSIILLFFNKNDT